MSKDTINRHTPPHPPIARAHTQMLDSTEAVPFRLTRNLTCFFTAFGVEGIFLTAMVNAAQVWLRTLVRCSTVVARTDLVGAACFAGI